MYIALTLNHRTDNDIPSESKVARIGLMINRCTNNYMHGKNNCTCIAWMLIHRKNKHIIAKTTTCVLPGC